MRKVELVRAVGKLAGAGEQAGISIEEMIQILNAGVSVETFLELIESSFRASQEETTSPARWIM